MSRYSRSNRARRSLRANSGLPGYDNLGLEEFDHPAASEQPELEEYGFDSDFGEEVRTGPYRSGPAPSSVSWEADHPAASDETREDYAETQSLYQQNLKQAMERKASKCIRIAESRLGKNASQQEIEDLALRFMDLPNNTINARVARLSDDLEADLEAMIMSDDQEEDTLDATLLAEIEAALAEEDEVDVEEDVDGDVAIAEFLAGRKAESHDSSDHMSMTLADDLATLMSEDLDAEEDVATHLGEMSIAEQLAEEIAMLKSANKRLARKVQKLAEQSEEVPAVEDGDAEVEEARESTHRQAKIERLAQALSTYMGEEADEDVELADLLAELEADEVEEVVEADEVEVEEVVEADEDFATDHMGLDAEDILSVDPKLASIFTAADDAEEDSDDSDDSEEQEDTEEQEDSDDDSKESKKDSGKKASYRPRKSARQASVKTLGNISREASSNDELSKLWESAPDVSKFFG